MNIIDVLNQTVPCCRVQRFHICLTIKAMSGSFFAVYFSLPHSHLAVHDIRELKVGQQVRHMKERLPVLLYDAMVTGYKRVQRVSPQFLETLRLVFRELL